MLSTEQLEELYTKALEGMTTSGLEIDRVSQIKNMLACYLRMFGETPHFVSTDYDDTYKNIPEEERDEPKTINPTKTTQAIAKKFKDNCFSIRNFETRLIIMDGYMLTADEDSIYGCSRDEFFPKEILDCIVYEDKEDTRYMNYVTNSSQGFNTMSLEVKKQEVDIERNYNDDLPHDKILDFINSEESGIMIFHGDPGTGKTSYLRNLIYEVDEKRRFMFLDSSVFNAITDASFVKLLINNKNAVVVLEDCETLLEDRSRGNGKISALLNLSDGILGDSLNLKFICTFNADLTRIDQALLRKGRMKLKYEFKALKADKVQTLAEAIGKEIPKGKEMPLCEIFNYGEDNGAKPTSSKKPIGFC